jgi:hypothetical protein
MTRKNFTRETKREARKRSGNKCEAVGEWYGLDPGKRCNADLGYGVEFDHIDMDANSKDNSLSNCAAVCIKCHKWKTYKHDIPQEAKVKRIRDKHLGIYPPSPTPIRSRGFSKRYTAEVDPDT